MINNNILLQYIFTYFWLIGMKSDIKIFQVNIVNNKSENTKIHGRVLWVDDFENFPDDEDLLEFMWDVPTNNQFVKSATELLEYLIKNKLMDGDKINICEKDLIGLLKEDNWNEDVIQQSLNYVLNMNIYLMEDGEISNDLGIHL